MAAKEDKALNWVKALIPLVVLLGGSEVWQYTHTTEQIKEVAHTEVENVLIERLKNRIDSLAEVIVSEEYGKESFDNSIAAYKKLNQDAARKYVAKGLKVMDYAIKNDSTWRYVFTPWIVEQMKKQYICPVLDLETDELTFKGFNVKKGRPRELQRNRKLTNDIYFYRDENDLLIPIYSLGRPIYKE